MSLSSFGIFVLRHAVFSISSCQGLHFNEHQIATRNHPIVTMTVSVPAVSSGRFQNPVGFDISFTISFALIMLTLLMKTLCCCPSLLFCPGRSPLAAGLSLWRTYASLSCYPWRFYLIHPHPYRQPPSTSPPPPSYKSIYIQIHGLWCYLNSRRVKPVQAVYLPEPKCHLAWNRGII